MTVIIDIENFYKPLLLVNGCIPNNGVKDFYKDHLGLDIIGSCIKQKVTKFGSLINFPEITLEVIDKHLFMLGVIKYSIEYKIEEGKSVD